MNSKHASPNKLNFSRNRPSLTLIDLFKHNEVRLNLNITSNTSGINAKLSKATSLTASKASRAAECKGVTELGFSNSVSKGTCTQFDRTFPKIRIIQTLRYLKSFIATTFAF